MTVCRTSSISLALIIATLTSNTLVAQTPPTLAGTAFVGGPGDQAGHAIAVVAGKTFAVGQGGEFVVYANPLAAQLTSTILPGKIFLGITATATKVYPLGESVPPVCGTVDSVGGVEPKSTVDVYDAATSSFLGCATSNTFPYSGYEAYGPGVADGPSLFAAGGGESCFGGGVTVLAKIDPATGAPLAKVSEPGVTIGGGGCVGRSATLGMTLLNGSLYLGGFSRLSGEDAEYRPVLMRYSQSLVRDWKARPADVAGTFKSVASLSGFIFAVGEADGGGTTRYLIEKYSETGSRIWSRESAGPSSLAGVVTVGGRLFAAGHTNTAGAGGSDVLLVEIDPTTGAILSSVTYGGPQDDVANGIATDGSDLFVVGSSRSFASADGNAVGQSDLMILRYLVSSPNGPPTAVAGTNQTARPGIAVQLNGSNSFDDNTPSSLLGYSWSFTNRPGGSAAALVGASSMTPTFTPDIAGDYRVQLVVTDQGGLTSAPSELEVSENPPPVVNAGVDQLVIVGTPVDLTGTASDPNGDLQSVLWAFASRPAGSSSSLATPGQLATTFVADVPGNYVADFVATDTLGAGSPDSVVVHAMTPSGFAGVQGQAAASLVVTLPPTSVTSSGNQNALVHFLTNAATALALGDLAAARQQFEAAIRRTDGCALGGVPDSGGQSRDWVTTCTAQAEIYPLLVSALLAITP